MDSRELRTAYLDFFANKGHTIVASSSLVPDKDATLLFTNAGMVQFKEALAFTEDRGYTRAASCQRCLRAGGKHNDLDKVGYTARHHTFFEMLGNFSFGDYFKRDAILFAWEFLTEVIKLPAERLWVTVHDSDDEAEAIWINEVGFDKRRITRLGDANNFWAMGDTGPCGPCSEVFYDHGAGVSGGPPGSPEGDLDRYVEIWNLVFTQFNRLADGSLAPLPKPCVDTGMGLERLAAVIQGVHSNYEIDLFKSLINRAAQLLNVKDRSNNSLKVIGDHIRAAVFLMADGVLPSNEGRGYVLRRIIRRAIRHGHKLHATAPFFYQMVGVLVDEMGDAYPLIKTTQAQIEKILLKEEQQFELTLDQGMGMLNEAITRLDGKVIPGQVIFKLYDTYGFPADLTNDIAREKDLDIDLAGFHKEMADQRHRARAASKFGKVAMPRLDISEATEFIGYDALIGDAKLVKMFKDAAAVETLKAGDVALLVLDRTPFYAESGGQAGDTGKLMTTDGATFAVHDTIKNGTAFLHKGRVIKGEFKSAASIQAEVDPRLRHLTRLNHSATHLMHAALRKVLGEHVKQRGSLVNAHRLRFDFSHFEALSPCELQAIEGLVNEQIRLNSVIQTEILDMQAAMAKGALALFGEKYSTTVRVLTMGGGFSIELCGGTHASRTGDIGLFRITSESGIAAGVRRIEALTGPGAEAHIERMDAQLSAMAQLLKADKNNLLARVKHLLHRTALLEKELAGLNTQLVGAAGQDIAASAIEISGVKVIVRQLASGDSKMLSNLLDQLKNKLQSGIVVLAAVNNGKIALVVGVTKDLTDKVQAGPLVNHIAAQVGGKGGGRPDMARAGGKDVSALPAALDSVTAYLEDIL